MAKLTAYRQDGTEVHPGDIIESDRSGESMRYQYATRPTTDGKSSKIMVNPLEYDTDGGTEVYAVHFGLTVVEQTPEGAALTEATQARLAADPFAHIDTEADKAAELSAAIDGDPWAPGPVDPPAAEADVPAEYVAAEVDTFLARDVKRGWHMAGVGVIETITGGEGLGRTFSGPEGIRQFPTYTLVEVTRPAPVMWAAEWPYPEFTAAEFAAHYQLAAEIIAARGYYAEAERSNDGTPGVSIGGALKIAARERAQAADPAGDMRAWEITAANVAEELETRLAAVIYTLGLLHSRHADDLPNQLAAWELGHYTTGPNPVKSDALGLLAAAAGIFTHISDTQAEVTAPPAVLPF